MSLLLSNISLWYRASSPYRRLYAVCNIYAYGTTIRVWYRKTYHTHMVHTIHIRHVRTICVWYEIRIQYTTELSTFSNYLHEAICYSHKFSKKIWAIFSIRSCPGKELWWWAFVCTFMVSWSIAYKIEFLSISLTHVRQW